MSVTDPLRHTHPSRNKFNSSEVTVFLHIRWDPHAAGCFTLPIQKRNISRKEISPRYTTIQPSAPWSTFTPIAYIHNRGWPESRSVRSMWSYYLFLKHAGAKYIGHVWVPISHLPHRYTRKVTFLHTIQVFENSNIYVTKKISFLITYNQRAKKQWRSGCHLRQQHNSETWTYAIKYAFCYTTFS